MPSVSGYPSMKAGDLLRVLMREPLCYEIVRQKGSHRTLESKFHPRLMFSFHDGVTVPPRVVKKILLKDIGLDDEMALRLLR